MTTPYDLAHRYLGTKEVPGRKNNHAILGWLRRYNLWPEGDSTPWCSAFCAHPFWLLNLPHSRSLAARSWLDVGETIFLEDARKGYDVVILWRGSPEGRAGHVGLYHDHDFDSVWLLGGNQGNAVSIAEYPTPRVLGVRRIT